MFEHMWNYDFQSYKHLQNQKSLQLKDIIVFKEKRSLLMQKLLHFNYKILGWRNSVTGINIGIFYEDCRCTLFTGPQQIWN